MKNRIKIICTVIIVLCAAVAAFELTFFFGGNKDEKTVKAVSYYTADGGSIDLSTVNLPEENGSREGKTAMNYTVDDEESARGLKEYGRVANLYIHANKFDGEQAIDIEGLEVMNLSVYGYEGFELRKLDMGRLSGVRLEETSLADTNSISAATNLKSLYIKKTDIENFDFLKGAQCLETLCFDECTVGDLQGFEALQSVTEFEMKNCGISDIYFVAQMENLKRINLSGNNISDISPLSGMNKLEQINLNGNEISDITPLSGLEKVRIIDVCANNIVDISPLSGLKNLYSLSASDNEISDITYINSIEGLNSLYLENNSISGVVNLSEADSLEYIHLDSNMIEDVILSDGAQVMSLDLSYNNVSYVKEELRKREYKYSGNYMSVNLFANNITNTSEELEGSGVNFWDENSIQFNYAENKAYCEKIDELVGKYINPEWDELHKALGAYLIVIDTTDYDYASLDTMERRPHSEYNALVEKMAVCDGYSYAYRDILRKLGIKSYVYSGDKYTEEDASSHAWNLVRIDGKYYHCDSTHDDGYLSEYYINLYNFGKSDEDYIQRQYFLWEDDLPACEESIPEDKAAAAAKEVYLYMTEKKTEI